MKNGIKFFLKLFSIGFVCQLALASCIVLNVQAPPSAKEPVQPPKPETPAPQDKDEYWFENEDWASRQPHWMIVPGWYRSHDRGSEGFELSILKDYSGIVLGVQDDILKYVELEHASLFTISFGVRKREDGHIATQATWSAPWFFVFPYGRKIWNDPQRNYEVGMMIKFPFGDYSRKEKRDRPLTIPSSI